MIKLLVLEELKRLDRDWTSFLFMSGFEIDVVTPKRTSKPRNISSPTVLEEFEERNRSSPPEPVSMEAEPLQIIDTPKKHLKNRSKQSANKAATKLLGAKQWLKET